MDADLMAEAVILAGRVGAAQSAGDLQCLEALLVPWRVRMPDGEIIGSLIDNALLARASAERLSLFRRRAEPIITRAIVPALRQRVAEQLESGNCGGPGATELADAAAALLRWVHGGVIPPVEQALTSRLAETVLLQEEARVDSLIAGLTCGDAPDLTQISPHLLRLTAVRWVVEALGNPRIVLEIARQSRRLGTAALNHATFVLVRFVENPDLFALFDSASLLSQVDDLIVLVNRVLDVRREVGEERTAFATTSDDSAMEGFAGALARFLPILQRVATHAVGRRDANPAFFRGAVRQLSWVGTMVKGLEGQGEEGAAVPPAIERLTQVAAQVEQALAGLAAQAGETAVAAIRRHPPDLSTFTFCLEQADVAAKALAPVQRTAQPNGADAGAWRSRGGV